MDMERLYALYRESTGVTTDSRKCGPGKLYFALKGERFDGNEFASQALGSGCLAAVVDDPRLQGATGMFWVEDGLKALQGLAYHHRQKIQCPVIGLTGSNGKTTTKELLRAVLSMRYRTHATEGNLNNHIGVPLTLLSIPLAPEPEMVVLEMGANHVGEIADLCAIGAPTHGVITNIGLAHLEGFGGPEGVKRGKRELFQFLANRPGSCVWVNGRHPALMEVSEGMNRRIYGLPGSPPWGEITAPPAGTPFAAGVEIHLQTDGPPIALGVHIAGTHNLDNILLALAVGTFFEVPASDAVSAIAGYRPNNNRSQWVTTDSNRVLLDAYNANPSSVEATLMHFASECGEPRAVILGDMAEMGDFSGSEHQRILSLVLQLGLRGHLVGPGFCSALDEIPNTVLAGWPDTAALAAHLRAFPYRETTLLVKGSRSMALETLLPLL